ncbi:hypothetical protein D9Q98_008584 [Chlorella vulgaris]|uniref:Uncharacterized protein n=1 Tax=Chlorella vulgaris TaxID=3077 RepID=A0A9D4TIC8_CHLVU|nr:hypothetical protein D9Q98_008584 [Chlorella vulgaris]
MLRSAVIACVLLLAHSAASLHVPRDPDAVAPWEKKKKPSDEECHRRRVRKSTLKTIKEAPFAGLFRDLQNSTEFEASAVTRVRGKYYAVFDNSLSIGYFDSRFQFRDPENKLVGDWGEDSQFEGIAYAPETDTFLLLHEAVSDPDDEGVFKPYVQHVKIAKDLNSYEVLKKCKIDFELTHENKGFESIVYLLTSSGAYLLGLCEGNYCKGGSEGKEPGNGRIIISQYKEWSDENGGGCVWEPVKTVNVPSSAYFADYSDMAYNYETQKLAVLSQEDSALWVGDFVADKLEFASEEGPTFYLPRDDHCRIKYCNAEGISWIDHYRVVVASDRAKSTQPFWCDQLDQSIHLFSMPRLWDPYTSSARMAAVQAADLAADEEAAAAEL